jgi:pimeloyl-ACP methyl ester carboxylesterase
LFFHRLLRIPYTLHVRGIRNIGKPKVTIVFLHGLGGSGEMWHSIIEQLQIEDVRIVTLDLIGFGQSAKPKWATYSTAFQAKSLRLTLAKLFITGKVIIVGHSLGSLVAIEAQRRYPHLAKALILCSPPLYVAPDDKALIRPERVLRTLFKAMESNTNQLVAVSEFATKYKIVVNKSFNVTRKNVDIFLNTLHAAISNQTAMDVIAKIRVPIEIVYGLLDPLVIGANLNAVARKNPKIHIHTIAAGHEVIGSYEKPLTKIIQKTIDSLR